MHTGQGLYSNGSHISIDGLPDSSVACPRTGWRLHRDCRYRHRLQDCAELVRPKTALNWYVHDRQDKRSPLNPHRRAAAFPALASTTIPGVPSWTPCCMPPFSIRSTRTASSRLPRFVWTLAASGVSPNVLPPPLPTQFCCAVLLAPEINPRYALPFRPVAPK